MKLDFIVKKRKKLISISLYLQRDVCRGWSGLNQMIYCTWWDKPNIRRGVTGCCRGLEGQTGMTSGCSRTKQLGEHSAGEARKDGIRRQDHNKRKKG